MKQRTSLIKRSIALALALVLLVSQANLGIVLHARAAENDVSTTIAEIIAGNYDLSEAEKNLLKSGYLVSDSYNYNVPTDDDNLVTVDTENAKITAEKYEGWTPVKAVITYGGETLDVALTDGVGTYDAAKVGNAFSVKVVYQLNTKVEITTQDALLGAAAILKQGVKNLDDVASQDGNLYLLEQAMPELVKFANEGIKVEMGGASSNVGFSDELKAVIKDMDEQIRTKGMLDLRAMIADYLAGKKTAYLFSNGKAMQAELQVTYDQICQIELAMTTMMDNLKLFIDNGWVTQEQVDDLTMLAGICKNLKTGLDSAAADSWAAANTTGLLAANVDYAELDALVAALGSCTVVTAEETLKVDETFVQVNMAMYNVTFKVVLNHIVDNELAVGFTAQKVETLAEGATAAELNAALQSLENELLVSDVYVDGKFDRSVTEIPATLTSDLEIVVTYAPKNFTVTIDGKSAEYPYGYKLTLPVHEDETKAYDYFLGTVKYAQGTVVTVEDNMTFTVKEGKAYTASDLLTIIANNYGDKGLTDILTSGALLGNEAVNVRYPDPADAQSLLTLAVNVLTAAGSYDSNYENLLWAPYSYGPVSGDEFLFNGSNTADYTELVANVKYRLALTNFSDAEIQKWLDLAVELETQAAAQKSALDALSAKSGEMAQLDRTTLGALNGVIDVTPLHADPAKDAALKAEFKAMVSGIVENCLNANGTLKILDMVAAYNNNGLKYYYENYADFKEQLDLIAGYLHGLLESEEKMAALTTLVVAAKYPEYAEKIVNLDGYLATAQASMTAPNAAINLESANLSNLCAALVDDEKAIEAEARTLYLYSSNLTVSDDSVKTVQIFLNEQNVGFIEVTRGEALTQAHIDALKAKLNAKLDEIYGTNLKYYEETKGSEVLNALLGTEMLQDVQVYFEYAPKNYTVKIDGAADQIININNLRVELPKAASGTKYIYHVDGQAIEVAATAAEYRFTLEQIDRLFVGGTYTIEREQIDMTVAALEKMVAGMNEAMGAGSAALVKENGVYTGITVNIGMDQFMDFVMSLVTSGYSYIGLNEEGLVYMNAENSLELSMQTLINAILKDDTFTNATVENLAKNGKGKLFTASLQLGNAADDLSYSDLSFTLNLNSVPAELTANAELIAKASNYIKFHGDNGALAFELNVPDKAYAVYASALIATGHVAKNDVNGMTQKVPVQFLYDYLTAITGSEMDLETYTNTLELLGFNRDLTDYVSNNTYTKLIAAYNQRVNVEINDDMTSVGASAPGKKSIDALMGLLGMDTADMGTYLGMLKEYKDGNDISFNATAKLANVDKTYYALVLDAEADGITNKIEAPSSYAALADATDELAGYSFVILTHNVPGNLTVSGNTVLDLNGFDVEGTINATGKLFIIDSSMDTYNAGVVENVTGNAVIIAGNYKNNISSMLKDGYYMDGTTVRNAMYSIKEENGNLTFTLNGNFYEDENISGYFPDAKALAVDIATDLLLNYFMTAKISVGGYDLVAIEVDDLVGLYAGDNRVAELAKQLIECVTIGEAGYENNVGFEGVVNMILADLLDFQAITDALNNNTALFSYEMTTAPWKIEVDHNKEKDYATLDVTYNAELAKTVNVALVVESQYSDNVAAMTEVLAQIVVKDETFAMVDIPTPTYSDKTLTVTGAGKASLVMDMSKSDKYATVIGVVLAYGNSSKAEAVAAAINNNDMAALKVVVDNTSVAEIFTALKKLDRNTNFAAMAKKVGVSLSNNEAAELEGKFHLVLCAAGKVLEELDITGMNSKLGALYNEETGYYELSKKDIFRDKEFNVRSYSALVELEATELTLKIKLFGDEEDCLWGDANHDNVVDSDDATLVELYSVGKAPELFCTIRTDVNGDGLIDTDDAALIRMYTVGSITVFPAENK